MKQVAVSIIVAATACSCGGAGTKTAKPNASSEAPIAAPAWVVPEGWRTETIPFPLEFAPSVAYRGVEELRFPKAFLTPDDDWFFSYAFVWYVAAPGPADAAALEQDLVAYFRGLAIAVGGEDRADIKAHAFAAELDGELGAGSVSGAVVAFDAFKTQKPVTLHFRVRGVRCSSENERALVFTASPRPPAAQDAVWAELELLGGAFRCP
jgi:hypothetical protein